MTVSEKVAYIKGLAEGLDLADSKEAKLIKAIIECLDDISENIAEVEDDVYELAQQVDEIDEDLSNLEDDYYDDEEDEDEDEEEELYEVTCPKCNDTIYLDEETLLDGGIDCPNCGEELEFDFECNCEDCEGCEED